MTKKTYSSECPARVDSQSPVRESQILMVPSILALAICFPSGLHATDLYLYLLEVSTLIRNKDENLKKTYKCECPVGSTCKPYIFESFTFLYFQHLFIKKSYVFEWPVSWTLPRTESLCFFFVAY